jgi:membrane protein DedA with SNARE-associated domain
MSDPVEFVIRHGYAVVFGAVLLEQLGLPIPAVPVLLAAGALAAAGKLSLGLVLGAALVAALVGDLLWYELGRRRGMKIVQLLCRISLEPDSCVRRTEGAFARNGARSLLFAKFVPGLSTVAPPLAGVFRMKLDRFVAFDGAGTLLWAGSFLALGVAFGDQLGRIGARAATLGGSLLAILLGGLALWIAAKFVHRQRFLRELRIARITPEELKSRLDAGEDVVVVDLRHSLDFEADPTLIPGARRMDGAQIEQTHASLPRDREIVLYCT